MSKIERIKAEIERLKNELIQEVEKGYKSDFDEGRISAFEDMITFIDSLPEEKVSDSTPLEESGEDLKSELHNYIEQHKSELAGYFDIRRVARHFANWQKQQDQSTIELAEDHAMLAGMEKMKQEMMENAVDGEIYFSMDMLQYRIITEPLENFHHGDEVKLIIIKEE